MNFHILTLFPDMVLDGLHTSIIGRAVENGLISIEAIDIRATIRYHIVKDIGVIQSILPIKR